MKDKRHHLTATVDGYTRFCLTAIVVLMTVMVIGLWTDGTPSVGRVGTAAPTTPVPVDRYQPRSTIDLSELVGMQKQTNDKLEEIRKLLESGNVKIQVVGGSANPSGPANMTITPDTTTPSGTTNTNSVEIKESGGGNVDQGANP